MQKTVIPEVQVLLKEFEDVFPENIPLGLPATRSTDHEFEPEAGTKPPSHRIYRMGSMEDAELKKQLNASLDASRMNLQKARL